MKLLINEFIKDYKKKTTLLYFILMFAILLLLSYLNKLEIGDDFNAISIMTSLTVASSSLAMVFSLIMLANNLSQEYSKGTVKFLYTRPKSRSSILTAKIVLSFINYIIFLVVGTIFDFATKYYLFYDKKIGLNYLSRTIEDGYFGRTVGRQLLISNLASIATMIFLISMVVLLCVVLKTQILSLVVVMMTLLGMGLIQQLTLLAVEKYSWVKYHMFDVVLFEAYYNGEAGRQLVKEVFKFDNANILAVMLIGYSLVFLVISYVVNARRDITVN